jgi:hypothetical protein
MTIIRQVASLTVFIFNFLLSFPWCCNIISLVTVLQLAYYNWYHIHVINSSALFIAILHCGHHHCTQ